MTVIFVIIILLLLAGCIYSVYHIRKQSQSHQSLIDKVNKSKEIALNDKEREFHKQLDHVIEERELIYNESIEKISNEFEKDKLKLNDYIKDLEKYSRGKGEMYTHKALTDVKKSFVERGLLAESEMVILGNIFLPVPSDDTSIKTKHIDHLVLLPQGIFVIETKYWHGRILHGVTKDQLEGFSYFLDSLFTQSSTEQTIVFMEQKEDGQERSIKALAVENPAIELIETSRKLKEYFMKFSPKFNLVKPIIYFGYQNYNGDGVQNYSKQTEAVVCTSREQLEAFFEEQLKTMDIKFDEADIMKMKDIMEKINYIS